MFGLLFLVFSVLVIIFEAVGWRKQAPEQESTVKKQAVLERINLVPR